MLRWLVAFLFTQLIEAPIYRRRAGATWLEAFGASAFTHPIVWFVIPDLVYAALDELLFAWPGLRLSARGGYWIMVVVAETFAVVAEGLYMRLLRRDRPLSTSLIANAASVTTGLVLRALFGVP